VLIYCSNLQALKNKKLLGKGEMQLQVGNGASVAAVAVGVFTLFLLFLEILSLFHV
jgi:hypothetical protein